MPLHVQSNFAFRTFFVQFGNLRISIYCVEKLKTISVQAFDSELDDSENSDMDDTEEDEYEYGFPSKEALEELDIEPRMSNNVFDSIPATATAEERRAIILARLFSDDEEILSEEDIDFSENEDDANVEEDLEFYSEIDEAGDPGRSTRERLRRNYYESEVMALGESDDDEEEGPSNEHKEFTQYLQSGGLMEAMTASLANVVVEANDNNPTDHRRAFLENLSHSLPVKLDYLSLMEERAKVLEKIAEADSEIERLDSKLQRKIGYVPVLNEHKDITGLGCSSVSETDSSKSTNTDCRNMYETESDESSIESPSEDDWETGTDTSDMTTEAKIIRLQRKIKTKNSKRKERRCSSSVAENYKVFDVDSDSYECYDGRETLYFYPTGSKLGLNSSCSIIHNNNAT